MSTDLTHRALIAPGFAPHALAEAVEPRPEPTGAPEPARTPMAPGEPNPAGELLADVIARGLQRAGWTVDYRWATYSGHALDARRDRHRYDVEVMLLDGERGDEAGRWLVTAKRRTGLFRRMFKGDVDPAEHELLRRAVDAALQADRRSAGEPSPWVAEVDWTG